MARALVKHKTKVSITKKFRQFDKFILENFELSFSNREHQSNVQKYFLCFFAIISFVYFSLIIKTVMNSKINLFFIVTYTLICHSAYLNNFLMFLFMFAVEQRLRLLRNVEKYLQNQKEDEISSTHQLKTALMMIHELIELSNDYFKPCFIQTMFLLHFCLVTNLYWISVYIFWASYSGIFDSLLYLVPSLIIILCYADSDRKIERSLKEIVAIVAQSKLSQQEEILSFTLNRQFCFSAFKLVSIGYSTFANVS